MWRKCAQYLYNGAKHLIIIPANQELKSFWLRQTISNPIPTKPSKAYRNYVMPKLSNDNPFPNFIQAKKPERKRTSKCWFIWKIYRFHLLNAKCAAAWDESGETHWTTLKRRKEIMETTILTKEMGKMLNGYRGSLMRKCLLKRTFTFDVFPQISLLSLLWDRMSTEQQKGRRSDNKETE